MAKPKQEIQEGDVSKVCGIVMPISECDGCAEQHWIEVNEIITDAIKSAGFEANLVSLARDVGVIHERIVRNLYENPIVVCDVSGRNPNVMFELGMRLAFDKPTIIVKDDRTSYSFDTSGIEHLGYPRDLRFSKIIEFKLQLASKIVATFERAQTDKEYTTFLKRFGKFQIAKLETTEVSKDEYYQRQFDDLKQMISELSLPISNARATFRSRSPILFEQSLHREAYNTVELIKSAVIAGESKALADLKNHLQSMSEDKLDRVRQLVASEKLKIDLELRGMGIDPQILISIIDSIR